MGTYIKLGIALAIVIVVGTMLKLAYNAIEQSGYDRASIEYNNKINTIYTNISNKVDKIEKNSDVLATNLQTYNTEVKEDISKAVNKALQAQLYVIKANKCELTPEFLEQYNSIVKRTWKK